ncbi:MAG: hypothetical protein GX601_08215 [Anaerolineales bacterium]|nr:hypothetical protein [Anaerolineales bacterium]
MSGIDTIPLIEGSKAPALLGWRNLPSSEQWSEVDGAACNIGVLGGGDLGLAVVDCDDDGAVRNVGVGLNALGLADLPTVETPSGGRHYYLRLAAVPLVDGHARALAREVGLGELRFGRGAYVVSPRSVVNGQEYVFITGAPELIPTVPQVAWRDLAWLLDEEPAAPPAVDMPSLPVPLLWRERPRAVDALLRELATVEAGAPVGDYASRSEAEQAVVVKLVLAGWSFTQVAELFESAQPAHYRDHGDPLAYLRLCWARGLAYVREHPQRRLIAEAYRQIEGQPWPGRGGALDQRVALGLLSLAYMVARPQVAAAARDLAQHAAASVGGVCNALRRLRRAGLVAAMEAWRDDHEDRARATQYDVSGLLSMDKLEHMSPVQSPVTYVQVCPQEGHAPDLWSPGGLGRSAGLVYRLLGDEAADTSTLAQATGKCERTVRRALARLAAHDLAARVEGGWVRGPVDVADVAVAFECERKAAERRSRHARQRDAFRRMRQDRRALRNEAGGCDGRDQVEAFHGRADLR